MPEKIRHKQRWLSIRAVKLAISDLDLGILSLSLGSEQLSDQSNAFWDLEMSKALI